MEARFHHAISEITPQAWDALCPKPQPFLSHAFLHGLEQHGCIRPAWGWAPHHAGLYDQDRLVAAAPLYLKTNSHGEFVFDWSWAHAYQQAGGEYYPKLLGAVPYSPVPGPRLLAGTGSESAYYRRALVQAMQDECLRMGLASLHVNFIDPADEPAFGNDWLARCDLQFHWSNPGYADFEAFLAELSAKKRKNIRQERRHVANSGLRIELRPGSAFSATDWQQFHQLYLHTFDEKGNHAALSGAMFQHLGCALGAQTLVATASDGAEWLAMALFLYNDRCLYGRYWGSTPGLEHDPRRHALHFELCYYQGIEYAIRAKLARFEPGAQGQRHKQARGFSPVFTHSRHYLPHPGFRRAVAAALGMERAELEAYCRELEQHSPYAKPNLR